MSLHLVELGNPEQPSILFLHGLGMAHRMWTPQLEALCSEFHVLAIDLPGFALSKTHGRFSFALAAQAITEVIEQHCQGKAHICGLSLGAMVALEVINKTPQCVQSLMLSAGQMYVPKPLMLFQRIVFTLLSEKQLLKSLSSSIPQRNLQQAALEDLLLTGKQGCLDAMNQASQADFRKALATIGQPTLILCGEADRPNLPAANAMHQKILKSELQIIPNAGHIWNLEQPEEFNIRIKNFVYKIENP
jgi:3-oxoadipate enol-lactonase